MPNRLAREKSPYLLQHKDNPVDWYPWGEEAFARARAEGKPIFLSVGYSTCHWCHVMERESFEDPGVAELMNTLYVNVKVDREERPDVDRVYMAFVQASTGGGGWPMSVWLTPELKPFFGGTYFPPRDAYGRPGFPAVLKGIAAAWEGKRTEVVRSSEQILEKLRAHAGIAAAGAGEADDGPTEILDAKVFFHAFKIFEQSFDAVHGGFGRAPKFPRPVTHNFLFRYFARTGEDLAARMVLTTLERMASGGMYDHLGGGFHRYSVDREWHVPHFEKMLYDQAQLVVSYLEGFQVSRDPMLARIARETCDYVLRDLTDPATGGFWSAEDADSPIAPGSHERKEGAFYVWKGSEAAAIVGPEAAPILAYHYGLEDKGNADDPHGELTGQNVLHARWGVSATAGHFGKTDAEIETILAAARAKLLAVRNGRPRPHLDDKVLSSWNGMMIGALAKASQVLGEPRYLAAATRAAEFVTTRLWDPASGTLRRRYRDGEVAFDGYHEDYAQVVTGLLDLYEAGFDRKWLLLAETIADREIALFFDGDKGGFFATTGKDPSVLLRMKDDYDGAEPSSNSVAALALARLAQLLDRPALAEHAERTIACLAPKIVEQPHAMPQLLVAHDFLAVPPLQVVIAGEPGDPAVRALLGVVHARFLPHQVRIGADEATRAALGARLPWLAGMGPVDGKAAAYVCKDHACERPVTTPEALAALLPARSLEKKSAAPPERA